MSRNLSDACTPTSLLALLSCVAFPRVLSSQSFKESKVDEETREESLDHVGFLFAYIVDKDIFHKYYSKLLSKRIIQLTSVSDEAEERMLENMRKVEWIVFFFFFECVYRWSHLTRLCSQVTLIATDSEHFVSLVISHI